MLLECRFSNGLVSKAIGLNSFDKISIEMFLVNFGLCVKMICCLSDHFFIHHFENIAVRLCLLFFDAFKHFSPPIFRLFLLKKLYSRACFYCNSRVGSLNFLEIELVLHVHVMMALLGLWSFHGAT